MTPRAALWLVPLLTLGLSCKPAGVPCETTATCGELQACLDEVCRDVDCLANTDCALESYCDAELFTCLPGCSTSEDCIIGERCDVTTNTCVPRSCRDTQLDCELGQRCDQATGTCKKDPGDHCRPCSGDGQCGPEGACMRISSDDRAYCFLRCSPEAFDPCPAGLQCSAQITIDGEPDGFRCVGLCGGL